MTDPKAAEKSQENQAADPHSDSVLAAVRTLIAALPSEERERILSELNKAFQPIPPPRSGDLLAEVIRLLPEQRSWRVEDVRKRIEERGIEAEPKAVYNVLTYLKRKGQLKHEGYGRYTLGDIHIVTSDDVGGAPAWSEIDDT
jgi:DNA-binding transcriptional ArsR family regulator